MQHITTKSSHQEKGRKVYARSSSGLSVRVPWDYSLSDEENHHAAARKLVKKLDWPPGLIWLYSGLPKCGFVYVRMDEDQTEL